ncbi:MAG TPA: hypothetical protein DEA73_01615, partial [Peptococcaceae bacterium]|nr:hypothetical protein [Peptococcaceae bacterium]
PAQDLSGAKGLKRARACGLAAGNGGRMLKFCREARLKPLSQAKVLPAREAFASGSQAGRDQNWGCVSFCPRPQGRVKLDKEKGTGV